MLLGVNPRVCPSAASAERDGCVWVRVPSLVSPVVTWWVRGDSDPCESCVGAASPEL